MEELHAACDKLFTEVDHLDRLFEEDPVAAELALSVAKRVRRLSTLLIQQLAAQRDATDLGGHKLP